ncbi:pyocin knob domain-containing protein [Leisingera sp. XS_AS12]|uniref:pyocin knob domain-containing protein n=1 Tax=Leisingera sp. XS_AS12 TaxID=3241294 RepID=UPI003514F30A
MSSIVYGLAQSTAEAQAAAEAALASETAAAQAAAAAATSESGAAAAASDITGREQVSPFDITPEFGGDPARFVVAKGPVGPFGWGGPEAQPVPSDDLDAIVQNGCYRTVTSTSGNHPPDGGGKGGNTVLHMQHSDNNAVQLYTAIKGSGRIWQRNKSGGVWGEWKPLGGYRFDTVSGLLDDTTMSPANTAEGVFIQVDDLNVTYQTVSTGEHVTTAGGLKLRVVPLGGIYHAEAWGSPVTAAVFNAAAADVIGLYEAETRLGPVVTFRCSSEVQPDQQLVVQRSDGSAARGVEFDFSNMRIVSQSGGSLTDTTPVLFLKARNTRVKLPYIDCNKVSSGCHVAAGLDCHISANLCRRWPANASAFGWKFDTLMDNADVMSVEAVQWTSDQDPTEYADDASWLGRGMIFGGIDYRVHGVTPGFTEVPIYIDSTASLIHFQAIHPWNGRGGGPARIDPTLIENHSAGPVYIQDSYLDNGLIHDYSANLRITNCHKLELATNVTLSDPEVRVYCNAASDGLVPVNTAFRGNIGLSVGYLSDPTETYHWAGDHTAIDTSFDEQNTPGTEVSHSQRKVNVFTRGDGVAAVQNFRAGGEFREEYHSAQGGTAYSMQVFFDPIKGTIRIPNLPTSSAGLAAGSLWNDAGTLKIS